MVEYWDCHINVLISSTYAQNLKQAIVSPYINTCMIKMHCMSFRGIVILDIYNVVLNSNNNLQFSILYSKKYMIIACLCQRNKDTVHD
jgi:hypothetical protein